MAQKSPSCPARATSMVPRSQQYWSAARANRGPHACGPCRFNHPSITSSTMTSSPPRTLTQNVPTAIHKLNRPNTFFPFSDQLARQSDGGAWSRCCSPFGSAARTFSPDPGKCGVLRSVLRPAVVWAGSDSLSGLRSVRKGQTCRICDGKAAGCELYVEGQARVLVGGAAAPVDDGRLIVSRRP